MSKYKKKYYTNSMLIKTLANGVSGSIRKGNIVNIFAKNPETDELELLVKNVYVEEACNNSGESEDGEDGVVYYTCA